MEDDIGHDRSSNQSQPVAILARQFDANLCAKCQDPKSTYNLHDIKRGWDTLIRYYQNTEDNIALKYVTEKENREFLKIHRSCQKDLSNANRHTKRRKLFDNQATSKIPRLERKRSSEQFPWKSSCLYCGKECYKDKKNPYRGDITELKTIIKEEVILQVCKERNFDEWALEVHLRMLNSNDFQSTVGAVFHKSCKDQFNRGRGKPYSQNEERGRKVDAEKINAFDLLCDWLDGEAELYTLNELQAKMQEFSCLDVTYSIKWLKTKLTERYKDNIFITELKGRKDIVCFRNTASRLISENWHDNRNEEGEDEAEKIIQTAAKLIVGDMRTAIFDKEYYPSNDLQSWT